MSSNIKAYFTSTVHKSTSERMFLQLIQPVANSIIKYIAT